MATRSKKPTRHGRRPGTTCALCGKNCASWQECVAIQRADPRRVYNPDDYIPIDCHVYTPAEVAVRLARFRKLYPFMLEDEVLMASILESATHVSAKAGGSAGSGQYSRYVGDCIVRARKRGVVFDERGDMVTPSAHDESNDDFY